MIGDEAMRSAEMVAYLERCQRIGTRVNGAVVRMIARRTGEDTNWFDAQNCTKPNCANH